jgi:hypothetical protein
MHCARSICHSAKLCAWCFVLCALCTLTFCREKLDALCTLNLSQCKALCLVFCALCTVHARFLQRKAWCIVHAQSVTVQSFVLGVLCSVHCARSLSAEKSLMHCARSIRHRAERRAMVYNNKWCNCGAHILKRCLTWLINRKLCLSSVYIHRQKVVGDCIDLGAAKDGQEVRRKL